jgi:prepilin-type N-terminal cleavage/methylation domain-containing protein
MKRFQHSPIPTAGNGFTLLEILIVVSIIGILCAISAMYARIWMTNANVEQQIQQMYADLVNARSRAMNYNRIHFVQLNPVTSQYQIWDDTDPVPDGDGVLTPARDTLLLSTTTTIPLWVNPAGLNLMQFDNRGVISGTGTIGLTNTYKAAVDCITVSPTRIRLGRWDGVANCIQ